MRTFIPKGSLGMATPRGLPMWVSMVDRADGTVWYLTHRVSDQRFGITDSPPPPKQRLSVRAHGAYDGPYLEVAGRKGLVLRLLIRNGRFGYEVVTPTRALVDLASPLVTTRRGNGLLTLAVQQAVFREAGDRLGYRVERDD